jgi:hypothetical protein
LSFLMPGDAVAPGVFARLALGSFNLIMFDIL